MMIVKGNMDIISVKQLCPKTKQSIIKLDGYSYRRLEFTDNTNKILDIQWLVNDQFAEDEQEVILEKIYKDRISSLVY